jgi:hypothetical protein
MQSFLRNILIDYNEELHPQSKHREHAFQCLDLVRQALLCSADATLEPITASGKHGHGGSTSTQHGDTDASAEGKNRIEVALNMGSGFTTALHICRHWTAVKAWIEENGV